MLQTVSISTVVNTCRALRQHMLGDAGDALEVVVTRVAEVRRTETEEHGHL